MKNKFFTAALLTLLGALPAMADEASLGGSGGNLYVEENPAIQMVDETIIIDVYPSYPELLDWSTMNWNQLDDATTRMGYGYVQFEITYSFLNTSDEPVEVLMGFPQKDSGMGSHGELKDFEALVLDSAHYWESIPVNFVDIEEYGEVDWYTSEYTFPPGETLILNRYWILPSSYKGPSRWFEYTLETGASWKDMIEEAEVQVRFHEGITAEDVTGVEPAKDYFFDEANEILVWYFEDLEPTEDDNLAITYKDPNASDWICDYYPSDSTYSASSSYAPLNDAIHYYPCAAWDGDVTTAWIEGLDGDARYEWIEVPMGDYKTYTQLEIFAGFAWDEQVWEENGRPTSLDIFYFNDYGEEVGSATVQIPEYYGMQIIDLPEPVDGREVSSAQLSIIGYATGSVYPDDVAISEVEFLGLFDGDETEIMPLNWSPVDYVLPSGDMNEELLQAIAEEELAMNSLPPEDSEKIRKMVTYAFMGMGLVAFIVVLFFVRMLSKKKTL